MTCLHPSLPNSISIYIDTKEEHCSLAALFLSTPASLVQSGIDHIRSHTSIFIGCVTGIYYQLGFVQEYLCTLLPNALLTFDSTRIPFVANSQCTQTKNHKGIIKKGKECWTLQVSWPVTTANQFDSYKYSKLLITARLGSVSSSTTTPHSSTEKALHGAQLPWVPSLLISSAQLALDSTYSK